MRFYSPKLYVKDPWIYTPSLVALLANIGSGAFAFWLVPNTETTYFLHNTIVFGVDLIGGYSSVFVPFFVGLGFWVLSNVVAFLLYGSDRFLARFVLFFLMLSELGIALALYLIVALNV